LKGLCGSSFWQYFCCAMLWAAPFSPKVAAVDEDLTPVAVCPKAGGPSETPGNRIRAGQDNKSASPT